MQESMLQTVFDFDPDLLHFETSPCTSPGISCSYLRTCLCNLSYYTFVSITRLHLGSVSFVIHVYTFHASRGTINTVKISDAYYIPNEGDNESQLN